MRRLCVPATLLLLLAPPASAAFPGPLPVPSKGCGKQLPFPTGSPLDLNVPVADPILFNKFRECKPPSHAAVACADHPHFETRSLVITDYLALPPGYNNTVPLPLVVSFHGFYDEAIDMQKTGALSFSSVYCNFPFEWLECEREKS